MGAGAIPLSVEKARAQFKKSGNRTALYTAAYGYTGDDKVDVSFNGGNPVFTPPRTLGRVSADRMGTNMPIYDLAWFACKALGITPRQLGYKLKKYKIEYRPAISH